jgi:hypothetical protein
MAGIAETPVQAGCQRGAFGVCPEKNAVRQACNIGLGASVREWMPVRQGVS